MILDRDVLPEEDPPQGGHHVAHQTAPLRAKVTTGPDHVQHQPALFLRARRGRGRGADAAVLALLGFGDDTEDLTMGFLDARGLFAPFVVEIGPNQIAGGNQMLRDTRPETRFRLPYTEHEYAEAEQARRDISVRRVTVRPEGRRLGPC